MQWTGVMPAITTAFDERLNVDHAFVARHARWLVANGCSGIVCLGSLGEAATLTFAEKIAIMRTLVEAMAASVPVVAAVSALSTAEAVRIAQSAADSGAQGLMILPPYVYKGDWRETRLYIETVLKATALPGMLYNNPVAYGTDFTPVQIGELSDRSNNLAAVKESSTDIRRVSAIRALTGDRLSIMVGVDDAIVEGIAAGAVGWVAGLVNALPRESVDLFNFAAQGDKENAFAIYKWLLPLLRMDTVPKFVQLIKQVQEEAGVGSARVRPPRLQVVSDELEETQKIYCDAMEHRPSIAKVSSAF